MNSNGQSTNHQEGDLLNQALQKAFANCPQYDLWDSLEGSLTTSEQQLDQALQTLAPLPSALESLDLWPELQGKLDLVSPLDRVLPLCAQLPEALESEDLWAGISAKLDSHYSPQFFSLDPAFQDLDAKSKYILGLSSFLDQERPLEELERINELLGSSAADRANYLAFVRLRDALRYSLEPSSSIVGTDLWSGISAKLFGEETAELLQNNCA